MNIVAVIGALASILGAVFSIRSAKKASRIKDRLLAKMNTETVIEIKTDIKNTLERLRAIGPSQQEIPFGTDVQGVWGTVTTLWTKLNENQSELSEAKVENIEETISQLGKQVKSLPARDREKDVLSVGKTIYILLAGLLGRISEAAKNVHYEKQAKNTLGKTMRRTCKI